MTLLSCLASPDPLIASLPFDVIPYVMSSVPLLIVVVLGYDCILV